MARLLHDRLRGSVPLCSLVAAVLLSAGPVLAQPAGNPKGTAAPSAQGMAEKAPATAGGRPSAITSPGNQTSRAMPAPTQGNGTATRATGVAPGDVDATSGTARKGRAARQSSSSSSPATGTRP